MTQRDIRNAARGIAGAWYEDTPHSERFYKIWPEVETFIGRNWPTFVPMARQCMVAGLGMKDSAVSPAEKEAIYKALQEDAVERAGKSSAKVGRGLLSLRPDRPGTLEQRIFGRRKD